MLTAKGSADDPDTLAQWTALGGRAFAREARAEDEAKEAIVVGFPAPIARGVATALRAAGLRFNRLRDEWEGRDELDKAATIANDYGGTIRCVRTANIATAAQERA